MSEEKIVEFFKAPENLLALKNSKNENEILEFLSKNGISVSLEKAKALRELFKSIEEYSKKLSEEELDEVIGGASVAKIAAGVALGILSATLIVGGGKFAYDVYDDYQQQKTPEKKLGDILKTAGFSKQSPYEKLVSETSKLIRNVVK